MSDDTRVGFITRPRLYCAQCGARAEEQVFGPIRREVWCAERACQQYSRKLNVYDPIINGLPHE